ncbi:hypothetical protein [Nocardioides sp. URHA0020]|uniref:hypothetical protein n=1 Tax=Nocardioides sp. URHA0020 TaxID=1380392 RepID=UPI00048B1122|nr:hypothetical protein [Nocardioides sp. URHA0020]
MTYLLLPSPLLGPTSWARVAELLDARVADPRGATTSADVLAAYVAAAEGLSDVVLVPHSNAGLYAPLLGARIGADAVVYVDAALAGDGPDTGLAPEGFLSFLRGLADAEGLLPPWSQWWDDPVVDLVPADGPRLPLTYFTSRIEVPPGWADRPSGYLAFGDTYAEEIAFARTHGWPLAALPGRHLHQLVAPADVAAAVSDLAARAAAP